MPDIWGLLPKAQDNPQTIDQAIAAAIADHEADTSAHVDVGESLYSHKASEVIDHLAESIVTDKLQNFNVTLEKLSTNKQYFRTAFETRDVIQVTGAGSISNDYGGLHLASTASANSYKTAYGPADTNPVNFATKNPVCEFVARFNNITNYLSYFGMGYYTDYFAGFECEDQVLYAVVYVNGSKYRTQINGISLGVNHAWRVIVESGVSVIFVVDGTQVYQEVAHVPNLSEENNVFEAYVKTKTTNVRTLDIMTFSFFQDL